MHDESLMRHDRRRQAVSPATPAPRLGYRVRDFDWDEIRTLDAGSWFVAGDGPRSARAFGTLDQLSATWLAHYTSGRVGVPSLEHALRFTRDLDWLVNVELKWFAHGTAALVAAVLDLVAATDTATRVLISSFDHTAVAAANHAGRRYGLGILTATPLYRTADYARTWSEPTQFTFLRE